MQPADWFALRIGNGEAHVRPEILPVPRDIAGWQLPEAKDMFEITEVLPSLSQQLCGSRTSLHTD
jgi:hypothetical protein